jgi:acylphosphatase
MVRTKVTDNVRLHAIVSGIVQGVNFRYYTRREAESLELSGWVANRWDGTVEVVAEGPRARLNELLAWLHNGPPSASVDGVQTDWQAASGEFYGFRISFS